MSYQEIDLTGLVLEGIETRQRLGGRLQREWREEAERMERLARGIGGGEYVWAGVLSLPLITDEGYMLSLPPVFWDRNFPGQGRILRPNLQFPASILDKGVSLENVFYPCLGESDLRLILKAVAFGITPLLIRGLTAAANTFGPIVFPRDPSAVWEDENKRRLAGVRAGYFPEKLLRDFFTGREGIPTRELDLRLPQLRAFFDTVKKSI